MTNLTIIGIMSGSSMDGVDIACCHFESTSSGTKFHILAAETIPYSEQWRVRLSQLSRQPIEIYPKTHLFYGRYLGQLVNDFIGRHTLKVDLVSSHGHTIFHQPMAGFTGQIGDGAAISAECGLPVVSDFRTMDLALGGQGAPLVPIGERDLFPDYQAFLNLGGISNISIIQPSTIRAYDISPCNIVLNRVARWMNCLFDQDGAIAASGQIETDLLEDLNDLEYYHTQGPKSLGREWINSDFWPLVKYYNDVPENDKMATLSEHIAIQIARVLEQEQIQKILVSGGGAFNTELIRRIRSKTQANIELADVQLIHFKEALIFAYLGYLRIQNRENVLHSVTGSKRNHIAGALFGNFSSLI